ncbi:MAG: acylphosphatase [Longimicrobiales bacterium]
MRGSEESSVRAGYLIGGRVQGVGFRWWTARHAGSLGVAGTVRNLPDGSVEVMLVGEPQAVRQMRIDLEDGPRFARVDGIAEIPCTLDADTIGFSIL